MVSVQTSSVADLIHEPFSGCKNLQEALMFRGPPASLRIGLSGVRTPENQPDLRTLFSVVKYSALFIREWPFGEMQSQRCSDILV